MPTIRSIGVMGARRPVTAGARDRNSYRPPNCLGIVLVVTRRAVNPKWVVRIHLPEPNKENTMAWYWITAIGVGGLFAGLTIGFVLITMAFNASFRGW